MGSGLYIPAPPPPLEEPIISLLKCSIDGLKQLRNSPRLPSDPDPDRWVNGIAYEPLDNTDLQGTDLCNFSGTGSAETPPGVVNWNPYGLISDDTCDTMQARSHDFVGRLTQRSTVGKHKAIEAEFWSGAIARASNNGNGYLTNFGSTNITPTGGTPTVHKALELLDAALGSCGIGSRGYIHMPVAAMPYLTTVRRDGNMLLNARDTRIIPGEGYDGSGPASSLGGAPTPVAAGTAWIFGTGPVRTWVDDRTDPEIGIYNGLRFIPDIKTYPELIVEAMDRTINKIVVRAEQIVLADWDMQCWFACLATLDT